VLRLTYATNLVAEWQTGNFQLAYCISLDSHNCSIACTDPLWWFTNFITCSLYPTFSRALAAGIFTDEQVVSLNNAGIYGSYSDTTLASRISSIVASCMAEYCQFSPGCSNSPEYQSCNSGGLDVSAYYGFLNATAIYDCLANAICVFKPQVNSDIAGIGVCVPRSQFAFP
jgi:hypothetical protein